jgi:hypothetical protein
MPENEQNLGDMLGAVDLSDSDVSPSTDQISEQSISLDDSVNQLSGL